MNYAIIAAGEGSRLAQEGISQPKPLVKLHGEAMIDRLIRIFTAHGATSITVIINVHMPAVAEHLRRQKFCVPFKLIEASTPSSMHSFHVLAKHLPPGKFCLTTVDTIFQEMPFADFIHRFKQDDQLDGYFAVTSFIDDEKPLYVRTDEEMTIQGFYDQAYEGAHFISGGIYCLHTSSALQILADQIAAGNARMRNYQRALISAGLRIKAHAFEKIIDVDHAADIETALSMLTKEEQL